MPTTEPITIARIVAASPTTRLIRDPQMNCVITSRPSPSVPSGPNSEGLAQVGLPVELIALRPASSASSGAASAIATIEHQDHEADHPGQVAAVVAPGARHRPPAPQPGDAAGRGGRGDRAHDVLTRGSSHA